MLILVSWTCTHVCARTPEWITCPPSTHTKYTSSPLFTLQVEVNRFKWLNVMDFDYESSMPEFRNALSNVVVSGVCLSALLPMLTWYLWRGFLTIRWTQPPLARWVGWFVLQEGIPREGNTVLYLPDKLYKIY